MEHKTDSESKFNLVCPYCGDKSKLVSGSVIYPRLPNLFDLKFWLCSPCKAYVGTHKPNSRHGFSGGEPLGRLANAELRAAKSKTHAAFDSLWKQGRMARGEAYKWLSKELNLTKSECHIGLFDLETCSAAITAINKRKRVRSTE